MREVGYVKLVVGFGDAPRVVDAHSTAGNEQRLRFVRLEDLYRVREVHKIDVCEAIGRAIDVTWIGNALVSESKQRKTCENITDPCELML